MFPLDFENHADPEFKSGLQIRTVDPDRLCLRERLSFPTALVIVLFLLSKI